MSAGTCPSELALEAFLLDPARSPVAPHVEACTRCAALLARMREEGEDFRRFVFPQTVGAVEDAFVRSRFSWPRALVPAAGLAVAALVAVLLLRPAEPDPDYEGVKGAGMAFAVFSNGDDPDCAVAEGEAVEPNAELWFRVQPASECWLWILSVDAKGRISRLHPPPGAPPERRTAGNVPGGARLDGEAGPERVFAVCAAGPWLGWDEVKAAAADVASGGAERVRSARSLGGRLTHASQASVLLEKRP